MTRIAYYDDTSWNTMILNAESAEHAPRKYVFIVHVFMLLILLRIKTIVPLAIEAHKMATIMGRKVQAA